MSRSFVVALIALLVALSGTSAAAVSLVLPRDSVGTPQLKANSVISPKVKDGSLRSSDFAPGVIPGPNAAYETLTRSAGIPFHADATVAKLAIPVPGSYVVLAKALVSGHGTVTCRLTAASDFDLSQATPAASSNQTIAAMVSHVYASSGSAELTCAGDGDAGASFVRLTAIRVASA